MREDMECKHRQVETLVEENTRLKKALNQISGLKAGNPTDLYWRGSDAIKIARQALKVAR